MKKEFGDRSSMWDLRENSTSAPGAEMEGARVLQRYLAKHPDTSPLGAPLQEAVRECEDRRRAKDPTTSVPDAQAPLVWGLPPFTHVFGAVWPPDLAHGGVFGGVDRGVDGCGGAYVVHC
jgi:hypothetical protein